MLTINKGYAPLWDETFEFAITVPELALIRFTILDHIRLAVSPRVIAEATIPYESLRAGYRHVKLASCADGERTTPPSIFIHVARQSDLEHSRKWWATRASASHGLYSIVLAGTNAGPAEKRMTKKGSLSSLVLIAGNCELEPTGNTALDEGLVAIVSNISDVSVRVLFCG